MRRGTKETLRTRSLPLYQTRTETVTRRPTAAGGTTMVDRAWLRRSLRALLVFTREGQCHLKRTSAR